MNTPLVSIITPFWNSARFLAATLESIQAQTEARWECILVDDGSTDESCAIAQRFVEADPRFHLVQQVNGGPSVARNRGLGLVSEGVEFIIFMDSDDIWFPHALEFLVNALQCEPEALAVSAVAEYIDAQGNILQAGLRRRQMLERFGLRDNQLYLLEVEEPTTFDALFLSPVNFPPGVILIRKTAFDRVGVFDEMAAGAEDWDVLLRMSRHGYIRLLDEVLLYYRRHDKNTSTFSFVPEAMRFIMAKTYYSNENSLEQQHIVHTMWRLLQRRERKTNLQRMVMAFKQRNISVAARCCALVAVTKMREFTGPRRP